MTRTRLPIVVAVTALVVLVPTGTASAQPTEGGCQAFGGNVSFLATLLGPVFGATASGVAGSAPGAFPEIVVFPEQDELC